MTVIAVPIGQEYVDSLWQRVQSNARRDKNGCLIWSRPVSANGYGKVKFYDNGKQRTVYPHRVAYVATYGEPDPRLTIDHLCGVRSCVEPTHLEAVTAKENILRGTGPTAEHARQTHCQNGHEFTDANTRVYKTEYGYGRGCIKCERERARIRDKELRIARALQVLADEGYPL